MVLLTQRFDGRSCLDGIADGEETMDQASGSSSIGEAVSGRGGGVVGEDDVYYIPERRPSLDLGQNSMDLNYWYQYHSSLMLVLLGVYIKWSTHRFMCLLDYSFNSCCLHTCVCLYVLPHLPHFFFRISESLAVGAAQPAAPSYGSLRSEQASNGMDHIDGPETRYWHIQQHKCIVLKPSQEILLLKWHWKNML